MSPYTPNSVMYLPAWKSYGETEWDKMWAGFQNVDYLLSGGTTPETYGAMADGTDDYASIQAALDASENGQIYFAHGKTYNTSDTLEVPNNCLVIIHGTVKLKREDNLGRPVFRNKNAALPTTWTDEEPDEGFPATSNITFVGDGVGTIDGDGLNFVKNAGSTPTTYNGSYSGTLGGTDPFYNATAITMVGVKNFNCFGMNISNPAEWAIRIRACTDIRFQGNKLDTGYGNAHIGSWLTGSANGSNQDGVHFESCNRVVCTGNISKALDDRIAVSALNGEYSHDVVVDGNVCVQNDALETEVGGVPLQSANLFVGALAYTKGTDPYVRNISFSSNVCSGGNAMRAYIDLSDTAIDSYGLKNIQFIDNQFSNLTEDNSFATAWNHVLVIGVQNGTFTGNKFSTMKRGGYYISCCDGLVFSDEIFNDMQDLGTEGFWGSPYYADATFGSVKNLSIRNCKSYDSIHNFIYFDFAADAVAYTSGPIFIENCEFYNFNSGGVITSNTQYTRAGIKINNASNVMITDCKGSGKAIGIFITETPKITLDSNKIYSCRLNSLDSCHGIYCSNTNLSLSAIIEAQNNTVYGCGGKGIQVTNYVQNHVSSNTCSGNSLDATSGNCELLVNLTTDLGSVSAYGMVDGNFVKADGTKSQYGIWIAQGSGTTSSTVISVGKNGIVIPDGDYSYFRNDLSGPVDVWLPTYPDASYWVRGDRVWLTEPSGGAAPGYVCSASGAGGTWKAMANLGA